MGFKTQRVSDLTGIELADSEVVTVNVIDAGKIFDTTVEEMKALKPLTNVMKLQMRDANNNVTDVLVTKAEFQKLVSDEKLASFDSNRGRRSGYSPAARNGAE